MLARSDQLVITSYSIHYTKLYDLLVDVGYSPMTIDEVDYLQLESKYSSLEVGTAKELNIESKYDKFSFGKVETLDAEFKYSNLKIDQISKKMDIESGS